ncbi:protein of unknown function [Afipia carboxidovorans OM5]|uniref:DUF1285 domain-containing protein n=1 Tax=Afipia carboxidovorans (strain ATCC 49405 / DSM 1227 / KCTC 32145 / OM5) TaxID=504832 RepID=B6JI71_AFIC5|nr:DUF1285 domain-containing protein [Afipia carboxidovorans]ACI94115.1 protein of unknown function [Afipia carboxidovorans OM5]AEI02227.1 hypothetical protein OCA4_c10840 [Afipia carboxidovorans OM4]AEI05803.1 concerved hypothetical protein [Afipia carboxidovorans OM5]BEV46587.1 DUF1285 domain-containing protein [Afipia carboxidovorans]
MAKQGQTEEAEPGAQRLDALAEAARRVRASGLPPVEKWNPPFCGDLDIRVGADGTWFYLGSPIGRPELVRLFASVLKREGDRYFLVTPVEKIGIVVDDAPFLAVEMMAVEQDGKPLLSFRTNVGDWVCCDAAHGLRFEDAPRGGLVPYLHVRSGLWAKLSRPLYYELVDRGEIRAIKGEEIFGVASGDAFFAIADAAQVKG